MLKNGRGSVILFWDVPFPGSRCVFRGKDSPKIPGVALCPAHNSGSVSGGLQGRTRQGFSTGFVFAVSSVSTLCFSYPWLLHCGN